MEVRIWLGSLADYNKGILRGEWLTLPMDADALASRAASYGEECFIADYETPLDGWRLGNHENLTALNETCELLAGKRTEELDAIDYLLGEGHSMDDALNRYEDVRYYPGKSLKEVAEDMVEEGLFGQVPKALQFYIDCEAIGRDLVHDGYTETAKGVFCET